VDEFRLVPVRCRPVIGCRRRHQVDRKRMDCYVLVMAD
jgi:hypothetical protein